MIEGRGSKEYPLEDCVPVDNWAHRSENMKCKTCMFFVPKRKKENPNSYDIGRCRINAPTMKGWPVMFVNDWCGEHKLDENKIGTGSGMSPQDIFEKYKNAESDLNAGNIGGLPKAPSPGDTGDPPS